MQNVLLGAAYSFERVLLNAALLVAPFGLLARAWAKRMESLALSSSDRTLKDGRVFVSFIVLVAVAAFFFAHRALEGMLYGTVQLRNNVVVSASDNPVIFWIYEICYLAVTVLIVVCAIMLSRAWMRKRKQPNPE